MSDRSWTVSVIGDGGVKLITVDEGSRTAAMTLARLASDPKSDISVRGLRGATKVEEWRNGNWVKTVARFIGGVRIS